MEMGQSSNNMFVQLQMSTALATGQFMPACHQHLSS
jgi:hypothetical protein